jgi:hypothetical protein
MMMKILKIPHFLVVQPSIMLLQQPRVFREEAKISEMRRMYFLCQLG